MDNSVTVANLEVFQTVSGRKMIAVILPQLLQVSTCLVSDSGQVWKVSDRFTVKGLFFHVIQGVDHTDKPFIGQVLQVADSGLIA